MKESNYILTPRGEIEARIKRLQEHMGDLTGAIILGSINLGYFSGTSQEGLIYIPRDGQPTLMIRKSLERAAEEAAVAPPAPEEPEIPTKGSGYPLRRQDRPGAGYTALQLLPPAGGLPGPGCGHLGHLRGDQADSIGQVGL